MMRYLLLLSIFFIGCAPNAYKSLMPTNVDEDCILRFVPEWNRTLYKAEIDVIGNHLTGIIIIKKRN